MKGVNMAGSHTLGTIRGTIEIDYDGAGIVKAIRDTDKLKNSGDRLSKSSTRVLSTFGKFAKTAALMGASSLALHSSLQFVAATLAVMAPLAGAAFAAAPGLIGAYIAASVILKVALAGVGDALKAAGGDSKKFEKAIEKLSPQAKAFARAYREALPVLGKVGDAIQDAFFKGTASQIGGVVNKIASLKAQAVGVSGAMGRVVQNIVKFATSGRSIEGVRTILSGLNAFLIRIRGSIGPVVQAFIGLAAQMGQFGDNIGGTVNGALAKLAHWLNSIDVAAIFEKAGPIVEALGVFLKNVAVIAGELFSVFNVDGAGAAGILGELAGKLAAFLQSAQGQEVIAALGQAMSAVSGSAGQIFLALLTALAPVIVALAPGVATLATQIASVLVPALAAASPLLTAIAGFLSRNMNVIGPLVGVVVALAGAYKVYAAAVKVVTAVKALELVAHAKSAAAWVAGTAAMIAQKVAMVASAVAMGVVRGAIIAWTAVQWLLNAALTANPIGIVIALIVAFIAVIVLLWNKNDNFRAAVLLTWAAIKGAIMATVKWITGTAVPFLVAAWKAISNHVRVLVADIKSRFNTIVSTIRTAFNLVKTIAMAVWNAVVSLIRTRIAQVKAVIAAGIAAAKAVWNAYLNGIKLVASTIWNAIVSLVKSRIAQVKAVIAGIRTIIAVVRGAFNSAKSAASSVINQIVSLVRSLPGRAASALGNLGGLLRSKGAALVQGLISGILGKIGDLRAAAGKLVGAMARFLPGSPAKEGPLSGKGYALLRARRMMGDIAKGINDRAQLPRMAMAGAVTPMARAVVPGASTTSSTPSNGTTTPTAARTFGPYNLVVDGKVLTTLMVDAITGNPTVVAKANKEGSRKGSWAGSGR